MDSELCKQPMLIAVCVCGGGVKLRCYEKLVCQQVRKNTVVFNELVSGETEDADYS